MWLATGWKKDNRVELAASRAHAGMTSMTTITGRDGRRNAGKSSPWAFPTTGTTTPSICGQSLQEMRRRTRTSRKTTTAWSSGSARSATTRCAPAGGASRSRHIVPGAPYIVCGACSVCLFSQRKSKRWTDPAPSHQSRMYESIVRLPARPPGPRPPLAGARDPGWRECLCQSPRGQPARGGPRLIPRERSARGGRQGRGGSGDARPDCERDGPTRCA